MLPHPRIARKIANVRRRAMHLLAQRSGGWHRRYSACVREEGRLCRGRNPAGWRYDPHRAYGFRRFAGEAPAVERAAICAAVNSPASRPALAPDGLPWE